MDNWHDEQAQRHQRDADAHWGAGTAGSSEQWGSASMAQYQRQQADWQREADAAAAAPAWALSMPVPSPGLFPSVGFAGASRTPADESQVGAVLWGLAKALLLAALALGLLAGGASLGAREAERRWADGRPGGGLGRLAAAMAFPGEELSPAAAYAGPASAAAGVSVAAGRRGGSRKARARPAPARQPSGTAEDYRCQIDAACASAWAAAGRRAPDELMWLAAGPLLARIQLGDEAAARDLCLLPLRTGSSGRSPSQARDACAAALRANPASREAATHARTLGRSWWIALADALG